jgi:hypothetical protein
MIKLDSISQLLSFTKHNNMCYLIAIKLHANYCLTTISNIGIPPWESLLQVGDNPFCEYRTLCPQNLFSHGNEGCHQSASQRLSPFSSMIFFITLYANMKALATSAEVVRAQTCLATVHVRSSVASVLLYICIISLCRLLVAGKSARSRTFV